MSRLRRRPSPALVVACLALAAALGGTGYSAIVLPANSVGTKQLKNNSVVSAKVMPHSLLASSFKRGQLQPGPTGPKGADGLAGAAGPSGPKGDSATKLFATVKKKAGGGVELGPSSGVQTLVRLGAGSGIYNLTFKQIWTSSRSRCSASALGPRDRKTTEPGARRFRAAEQGSEDRPGHVAREPAARDSGRCASR
jgi:hypothetical protein